MTKKEKEAVGRTMDLNPEAVMALKPDLVLVSKGTPANFVQTLSASGVPVFVSIIPKNWDDMEVRIKRIAKAVDEEDKGNQMIEDMREKRDALERSFPQFRQTRKGKRSDFPSGASLERRGLCLRKSLKWHM